MGLSWSTRAGMDPIYIMNLLLWPGWIEYSYDLTQAAQECCFTGRGASQVARGRVPAAIAHVKTDDRQLATQGRARVPPHNNLPGVQTPRFHRRYRIEAAGKLA